MQNREDSRAPDINYPVTFTGKGGEYFKIWIVNILLSIVTLYIYSAWAKVRSRRYFYGNTLLDNSPFEYHARGIQLLPGRLIAIALIALITFGQHISIYLVAAGYIFLFVVGPWALCRSSAFNARMSSYRNVRFGFIGEVGPFYSYLLFIPLAILLAVCAVFAFLYYMGYIGGGEFNFSEFASELFSIAILPSLLAVYLCWPWLQCRLSTYSIDCSKYGTAAFNTDLSCARFYGIYLAGIALSLVLLIIPLAGVFGLVLQFNILEQTDPEILAGYINTPAKYAAFIMAIVMSYLILIGIALIASAYISAKLRNYQYNRTLLDDKFQLSSTVPMWPWWWLLFSNLLVVVFTLGLAYPWAAVRKARFLAKNTRVISHYGVDHFIAEQGQTTTAFGEEIGDAFDMDVSAGL